MKYMVSILLLFVMGCGVKHVRSDSYTEAGMVDYSNTKMRHGSVFTPAPKTRIIRNDETQISKGELIYQKHCLSCHGNTGKGDGPNSKSLSPKPTNLVKIAGRMPDIHFFIQIDAGPGEMPAWRDMLGPEELQALTDYLQSLK